MQLLIVFIGILTLLSGGDSKKDKPLVNTKYGRIEGKSYYTDNGRKINSFTGIRYAKPPVGKLRFEPPQPFPKWPGIWKAVIPMPKCMQISYDRLIKDSSNFIIGNEDCLYLDVYTPYIISDNGTTEQQRAMPVIVNIHGGGFMFGYGGDYDPKRLIELMDVVFVTINYRLGPFGFLTTENEVVSGNMGLKDQVEALKWIKDCIQQFNGDPSNIILIGNSAGGASVHYHYLSPMSKDLFKKGISLSGSALCPWALMEHGLDKALMLLDSLDCPITTINGTIWGQIKCLRNRPGRLILLHTRNLFLKKTSFLNFYPISPFGPTIERDVSEPFLNDNPFDIIRYGRAKDAPWLASVVSQEGLFHISHILNNYNNLISIQKEWLKIAPNLLDFNYTVLPKFKKTVSEAISKEYLPRYSDSLRGWESLVLDEATYKLGLIELFSDRLYNVYMVMAAKLQAKYYKSGVYFYEFGYVGKNSITQLYSDNPENYGVSHADDLMYLHGTRNPDFKFSSEDLQMTDSMLGMWNTYINTAEPTFGPEHDVWKPVCAEGTAFNYMQVMSPDKFSMTYTNNFRKLNFWMTLNIDENLFFKYQRYFSYEYLDNWLEK